MTQFTAGTKVRVRPEYAESFNGVTEEDELIGREGVISSTEGYFLEVDLDTPPTWKANPYLFTPEELEVV